LGVLRDGDVSGSGANEQREESTPSRKSTKGEGRKNSKILFEDTCGRAFFLFPAGIPAISGDLG
jgi:hypothetical protein